MLMPATETFLFIYICILYYIIDEKRTYVYNIYVYMCIILKYVNMYRFGIIFFVWQIYIYLLIFRQFFSFDTFIHFVSYI